MNVLPADTYVVINKTLLSNHDRCLLIMLYQPIIGSEATNLFLTLWSYLDKDEITSAEWTHHHLMTSMRLKLTTIIEARERLEAIGLIKVYVKKDHVNNYLYELYSPISAYEFISNPILNISLYNNVGKTEYERLINHFRLPKINLSGYEDITCSFNEVFESIDYTQLEKLVDDIKRNNKRDLELTNKIDLDNVVSLIPDDLLNIKSLTKETKDLIYKLSFIYDLDEEAMQAIMRNSINEKKAIDKELIRTNSRNYYKFENNGKLPSVIYRNQPEHLRKTGNDVSQKAKLIYQFETTSPYDYLSLKNGGHRPIKNDLLILEDLLVDLSLTPGVTNVLIDYVLKINNNKLTRPFVLAIASQWKRSNLKTVEEAMSFAEAEQKSRKKPVIYNKNKSQASKPEWLDQDQEADLATDEEKAKIDQLLKEFK